MKGLKEVQCSFYVLKIAASFFNFVMRNFSKCSIVSTSLVFLCFFPSNGVAFSCESFILDLGNNFKDFFLFFDSFKYVLDLEQVCLSRLELAEIASQRHHALTSGNIVYACMRALEDAAILNELDLEKR